MSRFPRFGFMLLFLLLSLLLFTHSLRAQTDTAAPKQPQIGSAAWAEQAGDLDQMAHRQRPGAPVARLSAPAADLPDALSDFESEVIRLVNLERKQNDASCPNLTLHPTLRQVAYAHSKDMADRNFFSHTNPDGEGPGDRIDKTDYDYATWAENIAAGYETPQAVVEGWMNSEGHRRNILNCTYLDTGVGYYFKADSEWGHYWTQLFGRQQGAQPEPEPEPEPEPGLDRAAYLPLAIKRTAVAPQPNPGTNLVNGDFEAGPGVGWTESSTQLGNDTGVIIAESPDPSVLPARSGRYLAWLGGLVDDSSTLSQQITLPAGKPKLEYAYRVFSQESQCGYDRGEVALVRGTTAKVLATLELCSSQQSDTWAVKQIDLSAYAGQQWTLQFTVTTDDSLNSNFFMDDVRVLTGSGQ